MAGKRSQDTPYSRVWSGATTVSNSGGSPSGLPEILEPGLGKEGEGAHKSLADSMFDVSSSPGLGPGWGVPATSTTLALGGLHRIQVQKSHAYLSRTGSLTPSTLHPSGFS